MIAMHSLFIIQLFEASECQVQVWVDEARLDKAQPRDPLGKPRSIPCI